MRLRLQTLPLLWCCIFFVCSGSLHANSLDKPVIRWFYSDFPPIFITWGPLQGQGYGDKTLAYFRENLPEYQHVATVAALSRSFAKMRKEDGICEPALFKTPEREQFIKFSAPVYAILTNQMVTLKSNIAEFQRHLTPLGHIKLQEVLDRTDLTLGLVAERIYSRRINQELDKSNAAVHRILMPHDRYAQLLLHGRIDYAFGFPAEAHMQFKMNGETNAYTTLPIDGEPSIIDGFIGCSDKPIGRELIAKINRIIDEAGTPPAYQLFYEEWLDPNARSIYRQAR